MNKCGSCGTNIPDDAEYCPGGSWEELLGNGNREITFTGCKTVELRRVLGSPRDTNVRRTDVQMFIDAYGSDCLPPVYGPLPLHAEVRTPEFSIHDVGDIDGVL